MSQQKTVLIYTITYKPFLGGAEVAIEEVTKRLKDCYFIIITARLDRRLPKFERQYENVEVHRVGLPGFNIVSKNLYVLAALWWGLRNVVRRDVDIVWGVLESYGAMAASLLKLCVHDVFYIMTMQDGSSDEFWKRRIGWWKFLFKKAYHLADHITAISNYLIRRAREFYHYTGPMSLVPNGTGDHFFVPISEERRRSIRESWNVGDSDKVILTDSRLVEKNGVDTLIEAFAILRNTNYSSSGAEKQVNESSPLRSNSKLIIIGDGPLRKSLVSRVSCLGLHHSVIFMGTVPYEKVHEYYQASDIFCRPSRTEGFGNAFVQSMASRLVTIGTSVGGIVDFLKDQENGYVVPPNDLDKLAHVLARALEDSESNEVIRERGFVTSTKYRWDDIAQQYHEVFLEILDTVSVKKYIMFRQFVKYTIVGGTATGVDFLVFTLLSQVFGAYYIVANVLSVAIAGLYNFILSRKWTFKVDHRPPAKQLIAYAISIGVYLALSSALLAGFVEVLGFHEVPGKLLTAAIMWIWNFFAARQIVFRYF